MKLRVSGLFVCGLLVVAAWLAPLRAGETFMQMEEGGLRRQAQLATATPAGGLSGGLLIPTATSEAGAGAGGLVIPTATSEAGTGAGGLVIPTATPVQGAAAVFPALSDEQVAGLNLQPADVPASFAGTAQAESYTLAAQVAMLSGMNETALAEQMQAIGDWSGWQQAFSMTYTACDPALPISALYSEVAQLRDPETARRFVHDAQVLDFFAALGYSAEPARTVNGMYMTGTVEQPECFEQERDYALMFEYWGLWFWVGVYANAATDPALARGLLDQMATLVMARADALATGALPPTPVPEAPVVALPGGKPTPIAGPLPLPTLKPTPITGPSSLPTPILALATPQQIEAALPTLEEIGLPVPPFRMDPSASRYYSLDEIIGMLRGLGLMEVANATLIAAQANGESGQVARVFDTANTCPPVMAYLVEIDVAIFTTPQGAVAQLNDQGIQQAWARSGISTVFTPRNNGLLVTQNYVNLFCGPVQRLVQITPYGRLLVYVGAEAPVTSPAQTLLEGLDALMAFTQQKLQQAGIQ